MLHIDILMKLFMTETQFTRPVHALGFWQAQISYLTSYYKLKQERQTEFSGVIQAHSFYHKNLTLFIGIWPAPSSVPSSPMIIFIEEMICCAAGGDMEEAYAALWDDERMCEIISWQKKNSCKCDAFVVKSQNIPIDSGSSAEVS